MTKALRTPFSSDLQQKIDTLKERQKKIMLGSVEFNSPLLLAPMSAISIAPFRLLMEELGAGGTVSELISCHGINYQNEKTHQMLTIDPREEHIGIQLFGEDPEAMARAALVAQERNPKFIDINMGCPVRKVVTKGGGSALLKETQKLANFFSTMKKDLSIPLTVKIRTGWDEENINAKEVVHIAKEEGLEFVAIHGRTRTQQYKGHANWNILESVACEAELPIIGNGDLHEAHEVRDRMGQTNCQALMLGRGPLRNPFIFLESYLTADDTINFGPKDYFEVITRLYDYLSQYTDRERTLLVQMRKHIVWMAQGFPGVANFRGQIFQTPDLGDTMKFTEDYFMGLDHRTSKSIDHSEAFMTSGHG
ncbi:TIM-barrel protein, nifR3 family [Bacteriovorax sp. BSW11_IV]|uniref:tRNA dihydrouridine synthase n=1 Tax=Bacteriovorax sp. BSW11_IV TaxID=1353529 RepID=UPI00038A0528|nr:tRNA-dihydrouridine synthase [Bacteriovorax sp. BSW11_IV]EQC46378.1 TIM-barrel protein, nifR3 family [Bacteriovorax sp. BSW11_IV]